MVKYIASRKPANDVSVLVRYRHLVHMCERKCINDSDKQLGTKSTKCLKQQTEMCCEVSDGRTERRMI